jgi:hypothetical protein
MDMQGRNCYTLEKLSCIIMYEHIFLYKIYIRSFYVVNFNVSSTKVNSHAKLSRYV